jgi:hypothetical protein
MVERFKISIQLCGIKKRCRKNDRFFFTISYVDYNSGDYDKENVVSLVRDWIAVNMKEVTSQVRIHLDHTKVKSENGFTSTLWEPFSDKNVRFDITL